MTGPAYHGWTHRPKGQGGTDPVPTNLSWAFASNSTGGSQTTDGYAFEWTNFQTNDPDLFELTDTTNDGINIKQRVVVAAFGNADGSDSLATMYIQAQPLASYPTFGSEFGWGFFNQPFAFDTSLITATKSRRTHMAIGKIFPSSVANPSKMILASAKKTVSGPDVAWSFAGLVVVKIAAF